MYAYRLAVCEDDPLLQEEICRHCKELLEEAGIPHDITVFFSAEELEDLLEQEGEVFDILLLDIKLKKKSGMELAKDLRARNDRVSIIFLTGYEEYLREGYEVQPVHFLLKPFQPEQLKEALWTDWKLNHKPRTVTLQRGARSLRISLESILYAESGGNHSLRIILQEGKEDFSMTLTELESLLPPGQFIRCHNSYLVSLEHMREFGRTSVCLDNRQKIPIGRRYYKDCQEAFVSYMNRQ